MIHHFDVAIVGAGPAGTTTAICLSESNLRVALIDKAVFPRDKVCGDALSPDVCNQLKILPGNIYDEFTKFKEKHLYAGFTLLASNGSEVTFDLRDREIEAFVSERKDFDYLMFKNAASKDNVEVFEGSGVKTIEPGETGVSLILSDDIQIKASMIVGADGAHSVVASQLGNIKMDRDHHCGGVRLYYENVSGLKNNIELHYIEELLPGYLWIFPLSNNRANVGLGMQSSYVSKNKVNLKKVLADAISTHPVLSKRFENAVALETIKGMGLPMGSRKLERSGDRYLLLGDAAYLIDPLTGEGIGNAIRSGRIAADHLINAFKANRFDATFNLAYDAEIKRRMQGELNLSTWIARLMFNKRLVRFSFKYICSFQGIQNVVLTGFNPAGMLRLIRKPSFYLTFFKKVG